MVCCTIFSFAKLEWAAPSLSRRCIWRPHLAMLILYCTVLYWTIWYHIVVYIIVCHTVRYYTMLYCTILFCKGGGGTSISFQDVDLASPLLYTFITLYPTLHHSLHSTPLHSNILGCTTPHCITLHCTAVYYAMPSSKEMASPSLSRMWICYPNPTTLYCYMLYCTPLGNGGGGTPSISTTWIWHLHLYFTILHYTTLYSLYYTIPWSWRTHVFQEGGTGIPTSLY